MMMMLMTLLLLSVSSSTLAFTLGDSLRRPFQQQQQRPTTTTSSWFHNNKRQQRQIHFSTKESSTAENKLTADQLDFTRGYLNKHHHADFLLKLVQVCSPLGVELAKANAWSGGCMVLESAELTNISNNELELQVTVKRRNQKEDSLETVQIPINANPVVGNKRGPTTAVQKTTLPPIPNDCERHALDDLVRRLCRLANLVGTPKVTGKLIQLAIQLGGAGIGKLPENLFLNQVPHNRYVRRYFYEKVAKAVLEAVILCSKKQHSNRMQIISQFPEMNPSMDSYRIGTILEMARTIAITLAEQNVRVRICVQGSMGVGIFTGVPKQLNGVSKLLQLMDWQSEPGEENEGMIGNYVNFGAIGAEHVMNQQQTAIVNDEENGTTTILQHQDDVFLLIAPQSMVGTDSSIIPSLQAMVQAAGDRPVILLNPDLTDKVSAAGQQSVRGRQQRMDFANSFETIYHFQNIYVSGTSYFPILGAITKLAPSEPWVAHQRRDYYFDDDAAKAGEIYVPVLAGETVPSGEAILSSFER